MHNRLQWIALVLIALLLIASLAACGDDDKDSPVADTVGGEGEIGDIDPNNIIQMLVFEHVSVSDPWVRATVPGTGSDESGRVTGAFMIIGNNGTEDDKLTGVLVDANIAGTVEIHETTFGENDVMQMRPVDGIEIPAGGNAVLKPGSYHIMLLDVQRDLNPGEVVPITLVFESGITATVNAIVRELE